MLPGLPCPALECANFSETLAETQFRTSQVHRHLTPLKLATLEALCLESCMRCLSVVTMTRHSSLLAQEAALLSLLLTQSLMISLPVIKDEHNNGDCLSHLSAMLCWKIA